MEGQWNLEQLSRHIAVLDLLLVQLDMCSLQCCKDVQGQPLMRSITWHDFHKLWLGEQFQFACNHAMPHVSPMLHCRRERESRRRGGRIQLVSQHWLKRTWPCSSHWPTQEWQQAMLERGDHACPVSRSGKKTKKKEVQTRGSQVRSGKAELVVKQRALAQPMKDGYEILINVAAIFNSRA